MTTEAALAAAEAKLETLQNECSAVEEEKNDLYRKKRFWVEPKFHDVVDAFRADPVAALSKYTEIQTELRAKQMAIDAVTLRHSELQSQKSKLTLELRGLRVALYKEEKDKAMAPFIVEYSTTTTESLRMRAECVYKELGSAMTNSAAGNKFAWGHDENDEGIKKLDLELDAIAKVLMDKHDIKVGYKDNCILFEGIPAVGTKRCRAE
jgi:hypothetical protein